MRTAIVLIATLAACSVPAAPLEGRVTQSVYATDGFGTYTLAAGSNDDWHTDNCTQDSWMCQLVGDAGGSVLTGITLNDAHYSTRIQLWNAGAVPFTIAHASSASSPANRIHLRAGSDLVLAPGYGVWIAALTDWSLETPASIGWYEVPDHGVDSAVASTPSRTLGTAFRPSTDRLTLVTYSASADCTITLSGGQEGRVELLSDSANPPTTIRADVAGCRNTGTVVVGMNQVIGVRGTASYLVPVGDYVLVRSVNVTSTPSYAITRQTEQRL